MYFCVAGEDGGEWYMVLGRLVFVSSFWIVVGEEKICDRLVL